MKKIIPFFIAILLFSCQQQQSNETKTDSAEAINEKDSNSTTPQKVQETVPQTLAEIKLAYAQVVDQLNNNQMDSVSLKYNCDGERNGTVTYFSQNGKLKLIKHQYNEYDHYSATDQYYVSNEQLFFTHFNQVTWSFESNAAAEGATKDNITEQRIYIVKDQPIECLEKKFTIRSKATDNPIPANIPNKKVDCKPINPILKDFKQLVDFQKQNNHNCLGKS